MTFHPKVNLEIQIGDHQYKFTEHPGSKGMPYGQTAKRATVYQLVGERGDKFALKVFTMAFRTAHTVDVAQQLRPWAALPGLGVCEREVLTQGEHPKTIEKYPDLEFAVLMPWIQGETWQEILVSNQPITADSAQNLAVQMTSLMAEMENRGLAHCDIAGGNVLVDFSKLNPANPLAVTAIALVDVEEMYRPGLTKPEKLPAGTPGYNHLVAKDGLWSHDADRFAGAVMIVEMLTRHDDRIRRSSFQEQFFDPSEMQASNSDRFQLVLHILRESKYSRVADLFSRAWFSHTLGECPPFAEWSIAIHSLAQKTDPAYPLPFPVGDGPVKGWGVVPNKTRSQVPGPGSSLEALQTMLAKANAEGRWQDVMDISSQIVQRFPSNGDASTLQGRARLLSQLDLVIQTQYQMAQLSGLTEDWEACLRQIKKAQNQAKDVPRYEDLRQSIEQEYQVAHGIETLQAAIDEKNWQKANDICAQLPQKHPAVAQFLAHLNGDVTHAMQVNSSLLQAEKAVAQRNWSEAIQSSLQGLALEPDLTALKEILAQSRRELELDRQIADCIQSAQEAEGQNRWSEAESSLRKALERQPDRQSLLEHLSILSQKRNWAEQIETAWTQINSRPADDLLAALTDIPASFGSIDETRRVLQETRTWRGQLELAREQFDVGQVNSLLPAPPDPRVTDLESQTWLQVEQTAESQIQDAIARYDSAQVESLSVNLPEMHPLKKQCQAWLAEFNRTQTVLLDSRRNFDPHCVLSVLKSVSHKFPGYYELMTWAEDALQVEKTVVNARARHDLADVERLFAQMSAQHPARPGTEKWLKEERIRKEQSSQARSSFQLDVLANLLLGIPQDAPFFAEDWIWLNQQRQIEKDAMAACDAYDIGRMQNLLKKLPDEFPGRASYEKWVEHENNLRGQLQIAQGQFDRKAVQALAAGWPAKHPLRAAVDAWLERYTQVALNLEQARQSGDTESAFSILDGLDKAYPQYDTLHDWALEGCQRHDLANQMLANYELEPLEALLPKWPQDDPRLSGYYQAIEDLRQTERDLAQALEEAEIAWARRDWQTAVQICQQAITRPRFSRRFSEILESARREQVRVENAERLLLAAQQALFQKKYIEAIAFADQAADLLPGLAPYNSAGREMREYLINTARTAEKNRRGKDAKVIWEAIKAAPVAVAHSTPEPEVLTDRTIPNAAPTRTPAAVDSEAVQKARSALQKELYGDAVKWIKLANLQNPVARSLLEEIKQCIHVQAQAAQNAKQWDKAEGLWTVWIDLNSMV